MAIDFFGTLQGFYSGFFADMQIFLAKLHTWHEKSKKVGNNNDRSRFIKWASIRLAYP